MRVGLSSLCVLAVLAASARAACLRSIQSGTTTMITGTGSAQTFNVPIAAVDTTKSILFFNLRGDSRDPGDGMVRGQLTGSTNIRFYRANNSSLTDLTVQWYVAEFSSGVSVQRGTFTGVHATTGNVTINAVDRDRSFVLVSGNAAGTDTSYGNNDFYRARLTSATNLEIAHSTTTARTADWQVVEFTGASVQAGIGTMAVGSTSAVVTLTSAVDPDCSIVLLSWRTSGSGTGYNFLRGRLTGPAQVTIDRAVGTSNSIDYAWQVVEFSDASSTRSGNLSYAAADTTLTANIAPVDLTRSVPLLTTAAGRWGGSHAYTASDYIGPGMFTTELTDATTIRVARVMYTGVSATANAAWQVVQFNGPAGITVSESGGSTAVAEGGATDTYTIVLTSKPTDDVVVTATPDADSDLGAGAGVPIQLTFTAADWATPQTVTVTAADDAIVEGAHASTIAHSSSSADVDYNGLAVSDVTATVADNDTAGVVVTESAGSTDVAEGGVTDTYTIVLQSQPTADVVVTVDPDDQADVGGGAGVPVPLTFTPADWNVARTVAVAAADDNVDEGPHTASITHAVSSADGFYDGVAVGAVTVNVTDNDTAGVTLVESLGATSATEGGATDTYTIVLDTKPAASVTVTATPDGQTDLGAGAATPVTLTFTPANWNVPQTVTVTAVDDFIDEGPHASVITHVVASADAKYDGMPLANVDVAVIDNDVAAVLETGGSTAVAEGGADDSYDIVLSSQPLADVTVTVETSAQLDLGAGPGVSITFTFTPADWNLPQTITIAAVDDDVDEDDPHTAVVTHTAASADPKYNGTASPSVTVSIADNDTAGVTGVESGGSTAVAEGGASDTYTLVLDTRPTADVTITAAPDAQLDLGAGAGVPVALTFTPTDWNVPQTVHVAAVDDDVDEDDPHAAVVAHSVASADAKYNGMAVPDVAVGVTDNDTAGVTLVESGGATTVAEGGVADTYTIVLNTRPTADVTITATPAADLDLGAGAGVPVALTFTPADWNVPQTIAVAAPDDDLDDDAHASAVVHSVASADVRYDGMPLADVVVDVTDNDTAGVTRVESGGSTAVAEGGASDTYTLVLDTRPTADVTITVAPDAQLDLGGGAGVPVALTFTPADWNVPQTVHVSAVDNFLADGSRTAVITHAVVSSDPKYDGLAVADVAVAVADDDIAGVILVESGGSTDVAEDGATDSYALALRTEPAANVSLTVDPDDSVDVGAGPGLPVTLTFTPADWNVPRVVTVSAVDNLVVDGSRAAGIAHTVSSAGADYDGIAVGTVTVHITDNDVAGVTVTESGGSTTVVEGAGTDTYTVVLASEPTANVVVTADPGAALDVGGGFGVAVALTFTPADWNIPQTITVRAEDNAVVDGTRLATIHHTVGSADAVYDGFAAADVTVTVADDDIAGITLTESGGSTDATEGGDADSYTIVLNTRPAADVTVTITPDAALDLGNDPGQPVARTFTTSNWSTPQVVNVQAVDNAVADGPRVAVVVHAVASGDANYDGMVVPDVTVRIADDDVVGATITETDDSTAFVEGGSDSFQIVLDTEPVADVTITVAPDAQLDLGAGAGVPVTLTFTPADWSEPQTIEVAAPDDAVANGPRTASITFAFASADAAYAGLLVPAVTVRIADNDTAGVTLIESDGATRVVEGGETDSYAIRLNTEPAGNVFITVTPEGALDVGAGAGASITLMFTPLNWNMPQTVTVAVAAVAGVAAPTEARISHAIVSDDPAYRALPIGTMIVGITPRSGGDLSEPEPDEVIIRYTTVHGLCGVGVCAPLLVAASCLLGIKRHGARAAAGRARRGRRDDGGSPSNGGY